MESLQHPGLTDEEYARLVELDEKDVEGTMTWRERWEENRLLRKLK